MAMMLTFYHRTTDEAAAAILSGGFRDHDHRSGLVGVWVSSYPAPRCDGPKGNHLLAIETDRSPDDWEEYDQTDEGRAFAEWCIPAEILNRYPIRSVSSEEEAGLNPFRETRTVIGRHYVWQIPADRPRAGQWQWEPVHDPDPHGEEDPPWFADYPTMEKANAAAAAYFASLDS